VQLTEYVGKRSYISLKLEDTPLLLNSDECSCKHSNSTQLCYVQFDEHHENFSVGTILHDDEYNWRNVTVISSFSHQFIIIITIFTMHHSISVPLQTQNLPFSINPSHLLTVLDGSHGFLWPFPDLIAHRFSLFISF